MPEPRAPAYVVAAGIATDVVRFPWDEWNCRGLFHFAQPEWLERLDRLTNKANTSLTIAVGEWLRERFSPVDPSPELGQYLEAAWAGAIDPSYCRYTEPVDDDWRGPVQGPLSFVISVVNDALFEVLENPQVGQRVCWALNLAHHVLPDSRPFDAWLEAVLERLETFHGARVDLPYPGEEDLFDDLPWQGSPVPREAFDPARSYDPGEAPALLDSFLQRLDPEANPFLRSARDLEGIDQLPRPYRYERHGHLEPGPTPRS